MANIILRQANAVISPGATVKGTPLSNAEVDNNFSNINIVVGFRENLTTTATDNLVAAINEVRSDLDNLSSSQISNGTSNVNIATLDGPIEISANFLPLTANVIDLGSPTKRFRDLYLTGNTLDLDGIRLGSDGANLLVNGNIVISNTGNYVGSINVTEAIAPGSITSAQLSTTGVSAATYGNAKLIPSFTVGTDGRVTAASNISFTSGATLVNDTTTNFNYLLGMANATSGAWETAYVSSTKLSFNPSTGVLNVVDLNSTSDISLKDNITPISNPLSIVQQLQGIEFSWKESGLKSFGLSAQDVEKVIPEIVRTREDGIKGINYINIIAFLVEAIKDLNNKVDKLQNK